MNINASICRTSMYCAVQHKGTSFTRYHCRATALSNHFNMVWIAASMLRTWTCACICCVWVCRVYMLNERERERTQCAWNCYWFSAVWEPIALCARHIKSSSMLFTPLLVLLTHTCAQWYMCWEAHTKSSYLSLFGCVRFCFPFSTFLRCAYEQFTGTIIYLILAPVKSFAI